jgi:hypothetical protein
MMGYALAEFGEDGPETLLGFLVDHSRVAARQAA